MSEVADPDGVRLLLSAGIFVLGSVLGALTYLAWRRERDRKLRLVAAAYGLFALRGLAVVVAPVVDPPFDVETVHPSLVTVTVAAAAHASALLVLAGLLLFFVAFTRS